MKRDQLSECGGCGAPERFFLHNLRHRASYRRLCTNCVLKNHQGLFCPICLEVFNEPPPPHQRLICLKCPSISHLSCPSSHLSQSFTCPLCSNPNFSFFSLADEKPKSTPDNPQGSTPEEDGDDDAGGKNDDKTSTKTRVINKEAAKALLAAAKIAAVSMTKAAAVAKLEAERRVKKLLWRRREPRGS
ncbi:Ribosomal protein L3 plastid isoform 1 [Hibiscus syriacus]|uniref:Ribosomal protein L3 plastid isoform 1 n=1 Tax=Hibiscus syriacus TaxID=106335 RepID=A0A6A3BB21_HIBSY|nr:uncharacterized protein LOC120218499 [Hibiscus syriacus]KAE8714260.1 Ribosomal protein L3 plastid isoform 1 [Hibiscus syriacus]